MSFRHFAYFAALAAIIAFRLAGGGLPASASDRPQNIGTAGEPPAVQTVFGAEDAGPLITGRSVAVSVPRAGDSADPRKGLRDGIGAAGFARR